MKHSHLNYKKKSLEGRDVLITFDDGDYSLFDTAMPILKKYHCPAAVFIITSLIDTDKPFWWDEILYYSNDPGLVKKAKLINNTERLNLIEELRKNSKKTIFSYRQLTLEEIKIMQQNGIDIANHSHTHPLFDKINATEIQNELDASTMYLRKHNFPFYDVFAYPSGNNFHSSEKHLSSAGIRFAFLFDHKTTTNESNAYHISRLSVNDDTPLWKFRLILSGWHSRIVPITKTIHKLVRNGKKS